MARWSFLKFDSPGPVWVHMNGFGLLVGALFPFYAFQFFGTAAFSWWFVMGCLCSGILVGSCCFLLFNRYYQAQLNKEASARERLEVSEHKMRQIAYRDELTGLPSRCHFYERFDGLLEKAREEGQKVALMFLDLDHFKKINDTLGHGIGDQVLKVVGQRLQNIVVSSVKVARFGGDEFVVLVHPANDRVVRSLAERICELIKAPIQHGHFELYVRTSIGICIFPEDGTNSDTLIKHADIAMYRAKEQSGNRFCFFSGEMAKKEEHLLQLEGRLHRALELNELHLEYQPQLNLETNRIIGAEALLRWNHPELGIVRPDLFIPVAEETGLIIPIGEWVLRTACRQAAHWPESEQPLGISVNLSARQLNDPHFESIVQSALSDSGLAPERLMLEITESLVVEDDQQAIRVLSRILDMGVGIALDDFGTGYSSLNYLQRLPITSLKIDRSNVTAAESDPASAAILLAVIQLAGRLSLDVVAEGVETESQVAMLQEYGCSQVQGFWFSRPLPGEQLARMLAEDFQTRTSPVTEEPSVALAVPV